MEEVRMRKKPSRLWYLVPILFGIIGGLIGYVVVKDEDRNMAKKLLIVGLIMTFLFVAIPFIFGFIFALG